nr:hypothetical protein [Fournierella massiliensis]
MRLGDLDQLMDQVVRKKVDWNNRKYMEGFNDCILRVRSMIHSAQTIDPESLPIVQQLRAELERVTAERDALLKELSGECGVCSHYDDCIKNHYSCCDGSNWEYCGPKKEE